MPSGQPPQTVHICSARAPVPSGVMDSLRCESDIQASCCDLSPILSCIRPVHTLPITDPLQAHLPLARPNVCILGSEHRFENGFSHCSSHLAVRGLKKVGVNVNAWDYTVFRVSTSRGNNLFVVLTVLYQVPLQRNTRYT